eukprot:COSAG01_NODE_48997_length_376_cov_0.559567_1_plen_103_part_01
MEVDGGGTLPSTGGVAAAGGTSVPPPRQAILPEREGRSPRGGRLHRHLPPLSWLAVVASTSYQLGEARTCSGLASHRLIVRSLLLSCHVATVCASGGPARAEH